MTLERVRTVGLVSLVGGLALSLSGPLNDAHLVGGQYVDSIALRLTNAALVLIPLGLAWGVLTFLRLGLASGWLARIGVGLALVGLGIWAVGGVILTLDPNADQFLTPLGSVIQSIGMILLGIATFRARTLSGWRRVVPLLIGLWFFIQFPLQFPRIEAGGLPSYTLLLGVWGILWALFGYILLTESRQRAATPARV